MIPTSIDESNNQSRLLVKSRTSYPSCSISPLGNLDNKNMSNAKTRPASRSSESGRFVTPRYAESHPRTTENERIRIGKK